eukprot:10741825-Alexandrium_andersonii.AAC.1
MLLPSVATVAIRRGWRCCLVWAWAASIPRTAVATCGGVSWQGSSLACLRPTRCPCPFGTRGMR